MATVWRCFLLLKGTVYSKVFPVHSRSLTTTLPIYAGSKLRYENGKATNNSSYGPLTDLPDYTYLDGRPTELSIQQTRRKQERVDMASRVMCLISEMQLGQEIHQNRLEIEKIQRKNHLQKKLKPKPKYKKN